MSEEEIREMCNDIYEGERWQPMIDLIQSKDKEIKRLQRLVTTYDELLLRQNNKVDILHSIIKEVREYIEPLVELDNDIMLKGRMLKPVLEILDKENSNEIKN